MTTAGGNIDRHRRRRRVTSGLAVATLAGIALSVVTGADVLAHPLGNFSVNHLTQIRFEPDRVVLDAIVDTAEIPTTQAASDIDDDGDGEASGAEFDRYGVNQCADLLDAVSLTIDGVDADLVIRETHYEQLDGQAGLQTGRLECTLESDVDFGVARSVEFADDFEPQRVGWREITATRDGVGLVDSPVPTVSVTNGLTSYPVDLLDDPSDVRSATFEVVPDDGSTTAADSARKVPLSEPGPLSAVVDRVSGQFNELVGREQLTVGVGSLAVALALLLGSSHALLPGHGKTVMAAYIAGRQGSVRDAVLVGATVTVTHTGGVLVLGLALSISSSLAGESVIGWLGVVSGLLIAALGAALLIGAIRHRPGLLNAHGHHHGPGGHTHGPGGHTHDHGDDEHVRGGERHDHGGHTHGDDHDDSHGSGKRDLATVSAATATIDHIRHHDRDSDHRDHADHSHDYGVHDQANHTHDHADHTHDHDHGVHDHGVHAGHTHDHDRGVRDHADHTHDHAGHTHDHDRGVRDHAGHTRDHAGHTHDHDHGVHDHADHGVRDRGVHDHADHAHDHDHDHADVPPAFSRRGLVGMGIAGGLVPSPSALVILLSAIALGRTAFGILLVLAYGVGMAATLTLAGVLLVKLRDRFQERASRASGRAQQLAAKWGRFMPYFTAVLVLVVGLGLVIRGLAAV